MGQKKRKEKCQRLNRVEVHKNGDFRYIRMEKSKREKKRNQKLAFKLYLNRAAKPNLITIKICFEESNKTKVTRLIKSKLFET